MIRPRSPGRWAGRASDGPPVDLRTRVGEVVLANPVMTASGTAGHADELGRYVDLARLGAVVVKSLSAEPWAGNPAPRVHETPAGMLNSVGLQGPGVAAWVDEELPVLRRAGARVVVSIWGTSVEGYARAASLLHGAQHDLLAVEANLSCPNLHGGRRMFAQDASMAAEAVTAVAGSCDLPVWAKLTPNTAEVPTIARAVRDAGASAVTLINTVFGMVIDVEARRPVLGAGGGGLSGPAIHPVAVRAVWDVHAALPELPIVGVGGVTDATTAVELLLAGASAVQVGTASFADPRAVGRVLGDVEAWCRSHGVRSVAELIGAAHER
ncbi:MAG: dihydroorotate dehydrogenase [Acidimicrobiales bacterium]|nr:dihydroorotate dehydrogenase [Acidimicrobiales bacterium]